MMNRIFVLIFVSLLFVTLSCTQKQDGESTLTVTNLKEVEPNNKAEEAQPVKDGSAVKGFINEPMDQDWYQITIPTDSQAILSVSSGGVIGLNTKMELFDSAGDELTEVDRNKEDEGEILTNYTLTEGDYYLRVRELWLKNKQKKSNDSSFYVLKIKLTPVSENDEIEPNNRGVEATPIQAGIDMQGYLSPVKDEDWYKLELPKEDNYYMAISLGALEGVDTKIAIYDPIEALILEKDAESAGSPEYIPNLGIDRSVDFYYIVVRTPSNRWQSNEKSQYQLRVDFLKTDGYIEIEPNNRMVRATPLAINDTTWGLIETATDDDWFKVENTDSTATVMQLEALGVKKVDLVLTVYNEAEEEVLTVNDGSELESEFLPNLGFRPGQAYYLKISDKLSRGNAEELYALTTQMGRYYNDEEFEVNNKAETASLLVANRHVTGYIHPGGDVDFYRLDLRRENQVRLDLMLQGILKVNTNLTVYDEELNEIAAAAERPKEETEKLSITVEKGIYYLKVFGAGSKESNYRDKYKLTATIRPIF